MRTILLAALLFAFTTGFAQEMTMACCEGAHMHSGMEHGLKNLDLTPEQTEKIDAIKMETEKRIIPVKSDIELKRLDLDKEMKLETPSRDKVMRLIKEIHDLELKIKQARVDQHLKVNSVLTSEQRVKFSKKMHKGMKMDVMEGGREHRVKIIHKSCQGCKGESEVRAPCDKHKTE